MTEGHTRRIKQESIDGAVFLEENRVTLVVIEGQATGTEYVIDGKGTLVGRNSGADLCLPDDSLSGIHASIELGHAGFKIRDMGSTNGTFVNGSQVQATDLKAGDRITLGEHTLQYLEEKKNGGSA